MADARKLYFAPRVGEPLARTVLLYVWLLSASELNDVASIFRHLISKQSCEAPLQKDKVRVKDFDPHKAERGEQNTLDFANFLTLLHMMIAQTHMQRLMSLFTALQSGNSKNNHGGHNSVSFGQILSMHEALPRRRRRPCCAIVHPHGASDLRLYMRSFE